MLSLDEWLNNGWLKAHRSSPSETAELLAVADRDLDDCVAEGLSADWQFGIAYNAALQLARAALHAAGYETQKGESHHYRTLDSLQFTIGADSETIARFQTFRKKRSTGVYEAVGMISERDAKEMIELASDLREQVVAFLAKRYPDLLR
jgi:hypothetical protein